MTTLMGSHRTVPQDLKNLRGIAVNDAQKDVLFIESNFSTKLYSFFYKRGRNKAFDPIRPLLRHEQSVNPAILFVRNRKNYWG